MVKYIFMFFSFDIHEILIVASMLCRLFLCVANERIRWPTAMPPYPMPDIEDELFEKVKIAAQKYVPLDFVNEESSSSLGGKIKSIIRRLKK